MIRIRNRSLAKREFVDRRSIEEVGRLKEKGNERQRPKPTHEASGKRMQPRKERQGKQRKGPKKKKKSSK